MQTNYMADISLRENKRFDLQKKNTFKMVHTSIFKRGFNINVNLKV